MGEWMYWADCGDGARMFAPLPELQWQLRYGSADRVRFAAAAVIESYEHLIHEATKEEASRRIKLLRDALPPPPAGKE